MTRPYFRFEKLPPREYASEDERVYGVYYAAKLIGYVWRHRGFSYRGTEGWNRGLRSQDFHPIEWGYSLSAERPRYFPKTLRRYAAESLLREFQEASKVNATALRKEAAP